MAAIIWLVAALILVGAEALSGELVLLMLAGGAFAGAATAAFTDLPLVVDGVVFALVSVVLLLTARPVARRHLTRGPRMLTNADRLAGRTAIVVTTVTSRGGRVRLDGDMWSARAMHEGDVFDEGQDVTVLQIDGATAVVWKG